MPVTVPAPPQTQTNAGSFWTVADVTDFPATDEGDALSRLMDGITFRPEACGDGGIVELCPDEPVTKDISAPLGVADFPSYGFWEGDTCSTLSGAGVYEETSRRVTDRLNRSRSWWVEQAIWEGSIATSDATNLTGTGAASGLVPAMKALIEAMNDDLRGSRGVVHVAQSVLPFLEFYNLVTRSANMLQVSGTDHVYVTGTGYPGTDPDGDPPGEAETWIYATGPIAVRASGIRLVPGVEFQAIDRSVNDVAVRAEMAAAPYFDPCAHLAINACLPDPGPPCET